MIQDDLKKYEFKKTLEQLEAKQGSGTELITIYIPPDKQIHDVTAQLRDEFGQCSNIKSKQTRTNVQDAISSILSHLKNYRTPPENGLAIFCGTILLGGDRTDLECIVIEPPEPVIQYRYRCSSQFELDLLKDMLHEKSVYGLLVLDLNDATWGFLRGNRIEVAGTSESMVPGKQSQGGQSSQRYERLRKIAINEFFKKVGDKVSDTFLSEPDFHKRFKGLIIGGPGLTKEEFEKGGYLHHEVRKKIVGLIDVGYTNNYGLTELVGNAREILSELDTAREKQMMERFLKELVKENGNASYGLESIRKNLELGTVDTLLISSSLDKTVVDSLVGVASQRNTDVCIISDDFEEGAALKNTFGGVAAILRFRVD